MKILRTLSRPAALLALCITFCIAATSARADDFGTWASVQAVKSIGSGGYAMARFEHRSYRKMSATECYFAMAGGGGRICNWLSGDLSYEFWKVPSAGDITVHKGVASLTGTLRRDALAVSLREKYELAFYPGGGSSGSGGSGGGGSSESGGGSCTSTLRSRVRVQYKIDAVSLTPYVMYEYFNGFGGGSSGSGSGTSSGASSLWIRSLHYAGTEVRLGPHSTLDFFYMYHLYAQSGGSPAGCHLLGVGYILSL